VLGLQEGSDAFPSPARESVMEEALLPVQEDFPDAEERRLLYVAITRARHRVWLLFNKEQPSSFVEVLRQLDVPVARKP
jgi:DNA helicase-4